MNYTLLHLAAAQRGTRLHEGLDKTSNNNNKNLHLHQQREQHSTTFINNNNIRLTSFEDGSSQHTGSESSGESSGAISSPDHLLLQKQQAIKTTHNESPHTFVSCDWPQGIDFVNNNSSADTLMVLQQLIQRRSQLKAIDRQLFGLISQCLARLDSAHEAQNESLLTSSYNSNNNGTQSSWPHTIDLNKTYSNLSYNGQTNSQGYPVDTRLNNNNNYSDLTHRGPSLIAPGTPVPIQTYHHNLSSSKIMDLSLAGSTQLIMSQMTRPGTTDSAGSSLSAIRAPETHISTTSSTATTTTTRSCNEDSRVVVNLRKSRLLAAISSAQHHEQSLEQSDARTFHDAQGNYTNEPINNKRVNSDTQGDQLKQHEEVSTTRQGHILMAQSGGRLTPSKDVASDNNINHKKLKYGDEFSSIFNNRNNYQSTNDSKQQQQNHFNAEKTEELTLASNKSDLRSSRMGPKQISDTTLLVSDYHSLMLRGRGLGGNGMLGGLNANLAGVSTTPTSIPDNLMNGLMMKAAGGGQFSNLMYQANANATSLALPTGNNQNTFSEYPSASATGSTCGDFGDRPAMMRSIGMIDPDHAPKTHTTTPFSLATPTTVQTTDQQPERDQSFLIKHEGCFDYEFLTKLNSEHKKLIAHQCHVCGSGFEDRHRLQQHLSIHLNLHPSWFEERTVKETMAQYESKRGDYLCQECSIRFETTGEFDKHMQLHGEKPHKCDLCLQDSKNVSFRFYRQLLTHLRSHCFLYCCRFTPNCKQKANRKDYLKLHILKHHLNNKLPECYTICCHR